MTLPGGKFAGAAIETLSDRDLREVVAANHWADDDLRIGIWRERRRRWLARLRARERLTRRQRAARARLRVGW